MPLGVNPSGQPGQGVRAMASAGIRKTPTGRYKVWWRLDDGSQGSQTFSTRDAARDLKHDLLARLARGTWVDPRLGKQTFETWAREWWAGWSADPAALLGRAERRAYTPEEFGYFLAGTPPFYRDHFIAAVGTGLRAGELLGLHALRVDLDRRQTRRPSSSPARR